MKRDTYEAPFTEPAVLDAANARHDAEMRRMGIDIESHARFGNGWNEQRLVVKGELTDKKMAKYEAQGFYSEAFRPARREIWQNKQAKQLAREGNFNSLDGRLVYCP